jgi:vacuolar protein sorting-associated protein 72
MTELSGEELQNDETFWGHETWKEEDDSDNESFRESDEASEDRRDHFDSDFDESESDDEQAEIAAGEQEEKELLKREKANKRKYMDVSKAGRELLVKLQPTKKLKGNRIMGDGLNAGLVLNIPGQSPPPSKFSIKRGNAALAVQAPPPLPVAHPETTMIAPPQKDVVAIVPKKKPTRALAGPTLAATRQRRGAREASGYATHARSEPKKHAEPKSTSSGGAVVTRKQIKESFTQEQLLLEAVNITEPQNERWLLGRQRQQAIEEATPREAKTTGRTIEKFLSRRGYLNTVHFPDMDHLPKILHKQTATKPATAKCVITGQQARYRDPKTGLAYYDAAAFRELRRRHEAGEALVFPKPVKRKAATKSAPSIVDPSGATKVEKANGGGTRKINSIANAPISSETVTQILEPFVSNERAVINGSLPPMSLESGVEAPSEDTLIPAEPAEVMSTTQDSRQTSNGTTMEIPVSSVQPESAKNDTDTRPSTPPSSSSIKNHNSGNRSSPRKRKPSAKALDNVS